MKPLSKRFRRKLFRCTKGAISILLCLLITPFLSISLSLVEYARYQEVLALTDELMELSGLSALTDYDPYLHNRFGLLAVSQKQNSKSVVGGYLTNNMAALGGQTTLGNVSVNGKLALSNEAVLRQQILDVTELTGPATVLLEDFNLSELKAQLQKIKSISDMMGTVKNIASAAESLSTAVDKAEALEKAINDTWSAVNTAKATAESAAQKLTDFYEKLHTNGITFPTSLTPAEVVESVTAVAEDYADDVVGIYESVNTLISQVKDIKTKFGGIKTAATELKTALAGVKESLGNIGKNSTSDNKEISGDATSTLEDVVLELEEMVEETLDKLTEDVVNEINTATDTIISESLDSLGLTDAVNRYKSIGKNEYFKLPLSDQAKSDILELVSLMPQVWDDNSPTVILQKLKEMFVPDITFNFAELSSIVSKAVESAAENIRNSASKKALELLQKLVNAVRGLFSMSVFFDKELNAFVDDFSGEGGYQNFLNALGSALSAVEKFIEAMNTKGALKKLKKLLEAVAELFKSFGSLLQALVDVTTDAFNSVKELISSLAGGDFRNIYERMLIASYAAHNFPNRTNKATDVEIKGNTVRLQLSGVGMTGFSFNQIARPSSYIGKGYAGKTGIDGLVQMFKDMKGGAGSDTMFKGAEMEAIIAGTNSEIMNQTVTFFNLYFVRLLCSLPGVFADVQVHEVAAACTIACWVVYLLYALIEPFCDCLLLVNGGTVPIIKLKCYLTASGIDDFLKSIADATMSKALQNTLKEIAGSDGKDINPDKTTTSSGDGGGGGSSGLSKTMLASDYESHMMLLALMNFESSELIHRIAILVRMETEEYYRQKNVTFSMAKTYTAMEVSAKVQFHPFVDLGLLSGSSPLKITKDVKCFVGY